MRYPDYPLALGVIRSVEGNTYETDMEEQISKVRKTAKIKCVDDLLTSGLTWIVD